MFMSELKLPLFSKASVLVVGDVMVDRYWKGPATRISPEAPVPVVRIVDREDRPGGAANVALNIASLGAACTLVGFVGNDENGRLLKTPDSGAFFMAVLPGDACIPAWQKREMTESG